MLTHLLVKEGIDIQIKRKIALLLMLMAMALPFQGMASEKIFCDCRGSSCICFIQLGDEGKFVSSAIKLLKEKGYCSAKQKVSLFDEGAAAGVMALQKEYNLPQTGMLDDETLTLLIFGMLPEELDAADPLSRGDYNWIPTDGGKKRHIKPDCGNILDPRKVSVRNAEALGYTNCKKCNKRDLPILVQSFLP